MEGLFARAHRICFCTFPSITVTLFFHVGVRMYICPDEIRSHDNENEEKEYEQKKKRRNRFEHCNFQHSMCTVLAVAVSQRSIKLVECIQSKLFNTPPIPCIASVKQRASPSLLLSSCLHRSHFYTVTMKMVCLLTASSQCAKVK